MTSLLFPLSTWPRRVGFAVGMPVLLWAALFSLERVGDPTEFIVCERERAGAPIVCEHRWDSWRQDPPPHRFVLDGATLELDRVDTRTRGRRSSRAVVIIDPVEGDPVSVRTGGAQLEVDLRRMLEQPDVLRVAEDDDATVVLWWGLPLSIALCVIPVVALGGALAVQIGPHEVSFTRVRAWVRGRPTVLPRAGLELRVRPGTGRSRHAGTLVAVGAGREVTILSRAALPMVQRAATEITAALAVASQSPAAQPGESTKG